MTFDNSKSSQRQRDEASVELLRKLREKLLSDDISTARLAAFDLARKQEDGLAILTEALFGNYPRTAKKAAAAPNPPAPGVRGRLGAVLEFGQADRIGRNPGCESGACVAPLFPPARLGRSWPSGRLGGPVFAMPSGPGAYGSVLVLVFGSFARRARLRR